MKKNYKLLIFDWDGTLVDSTAYIVKGIQQIAKEMKLPVPSENQVRVLIGLSFFQIYQRLFPRAEHLLTEFLKRYQALALQVVAAKEVLFPGVKTMLKTLKAQNYLLAIATGKSRAGLNAALQVLDLVHIFAATRCADETESKPHPQMVYELLSELAVAPEQALLLGDTGYDMQLAQNAGIAVLAVGCGVQPLEQLRAYKPLAELTQTSDLQAWLQT
jgi:phosphoglycolate phosphatase